MAKTNAERQREWRERSDDVTLTVKLTAEEADYIKVLFNEQIHDGTKGQFYRNALVQGAKFRANSGSRKKWK